MRATHIDFAAQPLRSSYLSYPLRRGLWLLVLGGAFAGAAMVDDTHRSEEFEQTMSRLERARTAYKRVRGVQAASPKTELTAFRQQGDIARRLVLPWGDLLDVLEQADNGNIALLTVEPDAERGRLRLAGEARNTAALAKYIQSLEDKANISDVRLVTQQIKPNDARQPIEFVLESNWLRRTRVPVASGAPVAPVAPIAKGSKS